MIRNKVLIHKKIQGITKKICIYVIISMVIMSVFIACRPKYPTASSSKLALENDLKHRKTSISPQIEDMYVIPNTLNLFLLDIPAVVQRNARKDVIIRDFEKNTGLSIDKELKKYLERQKIYDKSNIFSDIP